jgi:hypothetical protein
LTLDAVCPYARGAVLDATLILGFKGVGLRGLPDMVPQIDHVKLLGVGPLPRKRLLKTVDALLHLEALDPRQFISACVEGL